ncbi:hypothetical protein L6452_15615 [Arctium lappa]|uniref:Uncharacterized protein n=1 Tax=Arctium lappa TaxID=4217 RepID=A0ACB9CP73_ARCLA|nr:hypothetical protein L6452_15615 [Arctium lappa]
MHAVGVLPAHEERKNSDKCAPYRHRSVLFSHRLTVFFFPLTADLLLSCLHINRRTPLVPPQPSISLLLFRIPPKPTMLLPPLLHPSLTN